MDSKLPAVIEKWFLTAPEASEFRRLRYRPALLQSREDELVFSSFCFEPSSQQSFEDAIHALSPHIKIIYQTGETPSPSKEQNAFGIEKKVRAIPEVKSVVAVGSGKGGVGKSTVTAWLALQLQALGLKVGILDADLYGPSQANLFCLEGRALSYEEQKILPLQKDGLQIMSFAFFSASQETPLIWRGPLIAKAFYDLCYQVRWKEVDILLLDLPPGTGDIQISMIETLPLAGAITVTTNHPLSTLDAQKARRMFRTLQIRDLGTVINMDHIECQHCGEKMALFEGDNRAGNILERIGYHREASPFELGATPRLPLRKTAHQIKSLLNF